MMSEKVNHIILVDDEEATLFFHTLMAEEAGVCPNVLSLRSGDDLIATLKKIYKDPATAASLIFLDINMPATNGWETLEEILQLDKSIQEQLHIYMASASEHPKDKEKCQEHPLVKDLIPKPITSDKVTDYFNRMTG